MLPPLHCASPQEGASTAQQHHLKGGDVEPGLRALVESVLGVESLEPGVPLGLQGLDSLAALELRQKIQVSLEVIANFTLAS